MWENSIRKAIDATKKGFPGGEIVYSMDKKSVQGMAATGNP